MHGMTVVLYEKTQTGTDDFGAPIYTETQTYVDDVLIGEPSTDDVTSSTNLYGKQLMCMLAIPKGDTHDWTDSKVSWTDAQGHTQTVKTFGFPIMGIEANVPTRWHMKIRCEAYS